LDAWTQATLRLEQTHEALRAEVQRLTRELEIKNRELARKNRLADLGQMASHVAHEVRNNLVPVGLYLNLLRRRLHADPDGLEILDRLETAFRALDTMVSDLLHFTRDREPKLGAVRIAELIREILNALWAQLEAQKITSRVEVPGELTVLADREMLRRAVLNVVLNALDCMPAGGTLQFSARQHSQGVELAVRDTGPGFPADVLPRVFEPFFTTKEGGTGLGLTIVQRIMEAHHGSVVAENVPEGGGQVRMWLPHSPARGGSARREELALNRQPPPECSEPAARSQYFDV
jgi:signal transduction histidine kinase